MLRLARSPSVALAVSFGPAISFIGAGILAATVAHAAEVRYYGSNATSNLNGPRLFWPNAESRNSIQASRL